jgi:hypothetical protein
MLNVPHNLKIPTDYGDLMAWTSKSAHPTSQQFLDVINLLHKQQNLDQLVEYSILQPG